MHFGWWAYVIFSWAVNKAISDLHRVAETLGRNMRSRRKAREAVVQALYQCDTLGDYSPEIIDLFFERYYPVEEVGPIPLEGRDATLNQIEANLRFAHALILGVIEHHTEIDIQLSLSSSHWSIERMSRVDRNILRLAAYELIFKDDIPLSVAINEAIELAKKFGSEESPMFINGVLDNLGKNLLPNPKLVARF